MRASAPGPERPPGGGHGNPSSILAWRIPMDRQAWWATIHGVAKSPTWLNILWHLCADYHMHKMVHYRRCFSREWSEQICCDKTYQNKKKIEIVLIHDKTAWNYVFQCLENKAPSMALLYPKTVRWPWNLIVDGENMTSAEGTAKLKEAEFTVYCVAQKRVIVVKVVKALAVQSCPTLCDPMDCSPPSMEFSRQKYWSGLPFPPPGESSQPRDRTLVSCVSFIAGSHWGNS